MIDDYRRMPQPARLDEWCAPRAGTVSDIDAELVGRAAVALGAGRDRADASVDPAAGLDLVAGLGVAVAEGEPVVRLAGADAARLDAARELLDRAIQIGPDRPGPSTLVLDLVVAGDPPRG